MQYRVINLLFLFFIAVSKLLSQPEVGLSTCLERAVKYYPLHPSGELYQKFQDIEEKKTDNDWLPDIRLVGRASWQSDVTSVDISGVPFPVEIPQPDKDQYRAYLEINQKIFDAGISRFMKMMAAKEKDARLLNLELQEMQLKNRVIQLFFFFLLIEEQLVMSHINDSILRQKAKILEVAVTGGVKDKAELDLIKLEQKHQEQEATNLRIRKKLLLNQLNEICQASWDTQTQFIFDLSPMVEEDTLFNQRPDIKLFDIRKKTIELAQELERRKYFPMAGLFVQAGYGKPGLNMLSDQFDPYLVGGIQLNWHLFDGKNYKLTREKLNGEKELLDMQITSERQKYKLLLDEQISRIHQIQNQIKTDEEKINLLEEIEKTYARKLERGLISMPVYLDIWKKLQLSRLALKSEYHLLNQAKVAAMFISGKI